MATKGAEASISPVEALTEYKWSLHKWSLLYLHYDNIKSPKIRINGVDGCTCRIELVISADNNWPRCSRVRMNFSDITHILSIGAKTSLLDSQGLTLWTQTSHSCNSSIVRQDFPELFTGTGMEKYLKNDTLIIHVEFTIVTALKISTSPSDVYSVNFEEIVRENLEAFNEFRRSCEVSFFIGGKKLFAYKIICACKTELFEAIFMNRVVEAEENEMYLNRTKVQMFERFIDDSNDIDFHDSSWFHDKLVNTKKYSVEDVKTDIESRMVQCIRNKQKSTPDSIIYYLCRTYYMLCDVIRRQALNFNKLNNLTAPMPEKELLSKYLLQVKNFDE